MNRDFVWFVIVIILGGNTLVMLNSEEAIDPNLIDIEELTCSLGEIMVSNVSLGEGYECFFRPAQDNPRTSCSGVVGEQRY